MKKILKILSYTGLALTLLPSIMVYTGTVTFEANKLYMIIGMLCWFLTAPFWMKDQ